MVWIVGMSFFVAGMELAWLNGVIQSIYESDITKLSVVILAILIWQSIICGANIMSQAEPNMPAEESKVVIEKGWLWSDIVLSLGMIGTVIGFMVMLAGFIDVDFSDFDSVQSLITKLSAGMSTSLSTTLVGLISSVILKLQFFNLESLVKSKKDEQKLL